MMNKMGSSSLNSLSHRERVRVRGLKKDNSRFYYPLILAFSTLVPNFVLPPPSMESSLREKEYPISGSVLKTKLIVQDETYNRRQRGDDDES